VCSSGEVNQKSNHNDFVFSWILFGLIYWAESYRHGDFSPRALNSSQDFRACIVQLDVDYPFTSTFLFSLETQTTIGKLNFLCHRTELFMSSSQADI